MGNKYSILIAVEKYQDARLRPVKWAEADASAIAKALEVHGYTDAFRTILLSSSATKTRIESEFRNCCRALARDDELLLFYAGHGFSDGGHNVLTCHDSVYTDLTDTSIRLQWLLDIIGRTPCERAVFLIDSCHSGLTIDESMRGLLSEMTDAEFKAFCEKSEYHIAFSACRTDQKSYSSDLLKHGIWSHHLIEALEGANKKALERGVYLTASSLQNFLSDEVPRTLRHTYTGTHKQTPCCWGNISRETVLADFTDIFAVKDARKAAGLGELRRVSFWGHNWGAVKSLSGFKRFHKVPDEVNSATQSFVQKIGVQELSDEGKGLYGKLKDAFGYKRQDLTFTEDEGSTSIITPDFTVNITVDIDGDDPSQYDLAIEVTDIRNPSAVNDEAFANVFNRKFDRIILETSGDLSVKKAIDLIEDADDKGVSVEYEPDMDECTVSVDGFGASVVLRAHEIELSFKQKEKVAVLLDSFKQLPLVLKTGNIAGLLPEGNPET